MAPSDSTTSVGPRIEREIEMALFMDAHTLEGGVAAADVAAAHEADLGTQAQYGVSYLRFLEPKT